MDLAEIQRQLRGQRIDGWLLFDHHLRDPIAYRVLGIAAAGHVSRRWYYWIPAEGEPVKLVHRIEAGKLDGAPGAKRVYASWREQRAALAEMLAGASRAAMQYSPDCMIPYVSLVDGGTVDLVRSLGKEVVTSAALVQYFEARWSDAQREMHFEAGRRVDAVLREAFRRIRERIDAAGAAGEFEIAQFIRERFAERGLKADDGPIVGANANSGNPHYAPTVESSQPIRPGDFVLIDLWAKLDEPQAVYYDVTWTGWCGADPPERIQAVFDAVAGARDKALGFVDEAVRGGREIKGWQVDDVTRGHVAQAGFGERFVHRTGHSIGEEVHGNGANMDNLETHDDRPIIPRTCFSIEPGVYLPEFGVRSEIDCYVDAAGARATGAVQKQIVRI